MKNITRYKILNAPCEINVLFLEEHTLYKDFKLKIVRLVVFSLDGHVTLC